MQLRATRLTAIAHAVRRAIASFSPASLFAANEPGVWYDPSDIDRYMTPLGPELVANGDFSSGLTGWAAQSSWSVVAGKAVLQDGVTANSQLAKFDYGLVNGKLVEIRFDLTISSGSLIFRPNYASTTNQQALTTSGTKVLQLLVAANSFEFFALSACTGATIDNISVRELTAIGTATMFQDAAGTTPVTAVEQPVGLILDKSRQQGFEDVTGAVWTKTSGDGVVTVSGNQITISGATTNTTVTRTSGSIPFASGIARMVVRADWTSATGVQRWLRGSPLALANGVSNLATMSLNNASLERFDVSTGTVTFTVIAFDYWVGAHASQTTATSRPVLSSRVNQLVKTEDFADAAWTKIEATVASGFTDSAGTSKAWKLQENAASANHLITISPTGVSSTTNRWSVEVKAGERNYALLFGSGIGGAYFNLTDGTSVNFSTAPDNKGAVNLGNGWWRIWIEKNAVAGNCQLYASDTGSRFSYQGTAGSGIYFAFPDLRPANQSALPYQRVNTATDYDAGPAFPRYLKFDGVDDSLVTPTITPGADKAQVFAGVRKLSGTGFQMLVELGTGLNESSFAVTAPSSANNDYDFRLVTGSGQTQTVYPPPTTNVLSAGYDRAAATGQLQRNPRINGEPVALVTAVPAGPGSFMIAPLYIGRRASTSLPFNGHLYPLIVRFGPTLTEAQITQTEQWVNSKTGAY